MTVHQRRCPTHGSRHYPGCYECSEASRADYRARTQYRQKVGMALVNAAPIRAHVENLLKTGLRYSAIATASGVAAGTIAHLLNSGSKKIHRDAAQRLLEVSVREARSHMGLLDATLTRRRLQHMSVMGWSQRLMADYTGMSQQSLSQIMSGDNTYVEQPTEKTIAEFFRAHWQVEGNSVRARNLARRRGWSHIMRWSNPADPKSTVCGDWKPKRGEAA